MHFSSSGDGSSTSSLADEALKQSEPIINVAATKMTEIPISSTMDKIMYMGDLQGPSEVFSKILSLAQGFISVFLTYLKPCAKLSILENTLDGPCRSPIYIILSIADDIGILVILVAATFIRSSDCFKASSASEDVGMKGGDVELQSPELEKKRIKDAWSWDHESSEASRFPTFVANIPTVD
ncbi:hypothetical protein Tco_1426575 [Tanacetum coccineum]